MTRSIASHESFKWCAIYLILKNTYILENFCTSHLRDGTFYCYAIPCTDFKIGISTSSMKLSSLSAVFRVKDLRLQLLYCYALPYESAEICCLLFLSCHGISLLMLTMLVVLLFILTLALGCFHF